jgi:hypothetical protein
MWDVGSTKVDIVPHAGELSAAGLREVWSKFRDREVRGCTHWKDLQKWTCMFTRSHRVKRPSEKQNERLVVNSTRVANKPSRIGTLRIVFSRTLTGVIQHTTSTLSNF